MMEFWNKFFRNINHAIWFWYSLAMLILVLTHFYLSSNKVIWIAVPLVAHVPPLATSSIYSYRKKPSEIYSKDCIWFNALMLLIYLMIWLNLR